MLVPCKYPFLLWRNFLSVGSFLYVNYAYFLHVKIGIEMYTPTCTVYTYIDTSRTGRSVCVSLSAVFTVYLWMLQKNIFMALHISQTH